MVALLFILLVAWSTSSADVSYTFSGKLGVVNALLLGDYVLTLLYFLKLTLDYLLALLGLEGFDTDGRSLSDSSGISIICSFLKRSIFSIASLFAIL
jgi:hypothetical protein